MSRAGKIILYFVITVIGLYFLLNGLVEAKSFLSPLIVAVFLSMLILPVCRRFEKWGLNRGWSAFFSDLLIVFLTFGFILIITAQLQRFISDWPEISKKLEPGIEQAEKFIEDKTGVNLGKRYELESLFPTSGKKQEKSDPKEKSDQNDTREQSDAEKSGLNGKIFSGVASSAISLFGFIGSMALVFIYIFFFLLYRRKLRKSLLMMVHDEQKEKTEEILNNSTNIAQQYLVGKSILILILAILYSVGLLMVGIQYAVFAALIAAILTLVPYIGNVIGGGIAVLFALLGGGGLMTVLGVILVFAVAQFIENNLLEPYVVGKKVELNPIVIIIIVILGEAVWGVIGMVVAIPITGMLKVLFDNIPLLRPYGYLLGNEDLSTDEGFITKMENWIRKKTGAGK